MKELPVDPSADVRDEIACKTGVPEPLNKTWFHKTAAAVIDADRCIRCGSCIAACPSHSIAVAEDSMPTLVRMCTGCSRCWDLCPLAGLRTERLWKLYEQDGLSLPSQELGQVRAVYQARACVPVPGAQDGGVVTTILEEMLRANRVDGVLLTRRIGPLKGEAVIARTVAEVREAAGSVYDQTLPLALLDHRIVDDAGSLAVVGTPCQITGLRALQRYDWKYRKNISRRVKLSIALFCTRSFDGERLRIKLLARGVDVSQASAVTVSESTLYVYGANGQTLLSAPVKEFRSAALRGCDECADFTGRLADISVGSIGSPPGVTTVIIRTAAGESAWQLARAALTYKEGGDLDAVTRLANRNRERAIRSMQRQFDCEAPLWISYEEHLDNYSRTDRAPAKPPPHRSHHYQTAC